MMHHELKNLIFHINLLFKEKNIRTVIEDKMTEVACIHIPDRIRVVHRPLKQKCELCSRDCDCICVSCHRVLCKECRDKHEHPITANTTEFYCNKCKKVISSYKLNEFRQSFPKIFPPTMKSVGKYIKEKKVKIVFLCGEGISRSAGIPDFKSPETGFFEKMKEFGLSDPKYVTDIKYFDKHPEVFYTIRGQLAIPGQGYKPTPAHYFMKFMYDKGYVKKIFTQNIDGLERQAGLTEKEVVECYGNYYTGHCRRCNKKFPQSY